MRKGYFIFLRCGTLSNFLAISCIISFLASLVFIIRFSIMYELGPWWWRIFVPTGVFGNGIEHAWTMLYFMFFFLLSVIFLVANICVNIVCEDTAQLLKDIEDKFSAKYKEK